MTLHKIGSLDEISDGGGIGIEVDGLELAVFQIGDEYYAIQNRCPHKSGPLHKGAVNKEDCSVHCPWHWVEFDLKTGENIVTKEHQLRVFNTVVEDGELFVEM